MSVSRKSQASPMLLITYAIIIIQCMLLGQCVPHERATKALEAQGFIDEKITKKDVLFVALKGCSWNDEVKFDAMATNARGERVHLIVCGGIFKGMTIRYK